MRKREIERKLDGILDRLNTLENILLCDHIDLSNPVKIGKDMYSFICRECGKRFGTTKDEYYKYEISKKKEALDKIIEEARRELDGNL